MYYTTAQLTRFFPSLVGNDDPVSSGSTTVPAVEEQPVRETVRHDIAQRPIANIQEAEKFIRATKKWIEKLKALSHARENSELVQSDRPSKGQDRTSFPAKAERLYQGLSDTDHSTAATLIRLVCDFERLWADHLKSKGLVRPKPDTDGDYLSIEDWPFHSYSTLVNSMCVDFYNSRLTTPAEEAEREAIERHVVAMQNEFDAVNKLRDLALEDSDDSDAEDLPQENEIEDRIDKVETELAKAWDRVARWLSHFEEKHGARHPRDYKGRTPNEYQHFLKLKQGDENGALEHMREELKNLRKLAREKYRLVSSPNLTWEEECDQCKDQVRAKQLAERDLTLWFWQWEMRHGEMHPEDPQDCTY
ncbi:hypothetical protein BU16DRAFT_562571 [Lophium mytilinum]|uniref:Uncharacterized protein n=1 Tax=Lophium mytilinum TaxID=390894 RepID=A0A6A6QRD0_9PEZI|nr:hypothetical protein BU16DRAFT_562571 [Lophium mytilinum]